MAVMRTLVLVVGSLICAVAAGSGTTECFSVRGALLLAAVGMAALGMLYRLPVVWRLSDPQRRSLGDLGIVLGIFLPSLAVLVGILVFAAGTQ